MTEGASFAALMFAGLFMWSGTAKALSPGPTAMAIHHFGITRIPRRAVAQAVAAAEVLLAVGLALIPRIPSIGTVVLAAMAIVCAVFTTLIIRSLRVGARFPCMCFGERDRPLSVRAAVRAAVLSAVALALALAYSNAKFASLNWAPIGLLCIIAASVLALTVLSSALYQIAPRLDRFRFGDPEFLELPDGDSPLAVVGA